jgi:hypothetical protein
MQDIHGIRPPVPVGIDPMVFKIMAAVLGGVILIFLLVYLIRKYLKKRKSIQDLPALVQPPEPYQAAMKDLDRLALGKAADPRLFYFDLTAILRQYMGRSFHINAPEMTSQEFIRSIRAMDLGPDLGQDMARFQTLSDPIKYAGIIPEKDRANQDLSQIRKIITETENLLVKRNTPTEKIPGEDQ